MEKDMTYLTEQRLGDALKNIFPNHIFIYNKSVPNSGLKHHRPDYRCEELQLIVEFDGSEHYTNTQTIKNDQNKDLHYTQCGYKIVRIPYFIQLSEDVIKHLFGVSMKWEQKFPHGFIVDKGEVLPCDMCSLGIIRFIDDLKRFSYLRNDIIRSLQEKAKKKGGDWEQVLPINLNEIKWDEFK